MYTGPVPKAIAAFIKFLPSSDQALARSYEYEFADYIIDDVVDSVRESLGLVEICASQPEISIDELARVGLEGRPQAVPGSETAASHQSARLDDFLRRTFAGIGRTDGR
jgi:hypothetical protein